MYKILYQQKKAWIARVGFCVFLLLAISTSNVFAATINVDCNVPELLDAIAKANADNAPDTLELASNCVFTLTAVDNSTPNPNGLPVITTDITLSGNGATIERSAAEETPVFGILQIESGVNVHINNLTLQNGYSPAGGAITNRGQLTLDHTLLLSNTSTPVNFSDRGGGAIQHKEGTLTITDSTLNNNRQLGEGYQHVGGGAISSEATLNIAHSQFDGNFAENISPFSWNGGGAIYISGGTGTIDETIFSNNSSHDGGAIANIGELLVTGSTFTSNVGAISNYGTLTLKNDTFTLNTGRVLASISHLTIVGSIFSNNTGGVLFLLGTTKLLDSQFTGNTDQYAAAITNGGMLSVSDSEFAQNASTGNGGGIYNGQNGKLDLTRSSFTNNSAAWGGGLMNEGEAVVSDSVFTNNQATLYGGGLANYRGKLHIKHSTFTSNHAGERGGGVISFTVQGYPVNLTLDTSTIENNNAKWGGGAYLSGSSGSSLYQIASNVNNSTFANNRAVGDSGYGGGLYATGKIKIGNTTFAANGADKYGGGIYNSARLTLLNVTLSKNVAQQGGALFQNNKRARLINTILANSGPTGNCAISTGKIENSGHNLATDATCRIPLTAKIRINKNGLQDNGGSTKTIALRPRSPAVDGGDDAVCAGGIIKSRDQRGVTRPQGAHCDIGAYELNQ